MKYPTVEEVQKATHMELCRWYRFLPSPGMSAPKYSEQEAKVMLLIADRLEGFGGFTPEISKALGWNDPKKG